MATTVSGMVGTIKVTANRLKLPQFFAILFFCDKIVPAILSWHPSVALGSTISVFGRVVKVGSIPKLPVQADVVAVVITIGIMIVLFMEEAEKRSAKRRFFGFGDTPALRFVLPATQPDGDPAFKLSNRALHHTAELGWGSFRQALSSVLGASDVKVFSQLALNARAADVELAVEIDVDLMHPKRQNPLQAKFTESRPLVSFGSPASNVLTKWLCEQHLCDPVLPRFVGNAIHVGDDGPSSASVILCWEPELLDYAILARVTDRINFKSPIAFFICAGVDQAGSIYTARSLFENWSTLCKETLARDFVYLYKIERRGLANEEVYDQADATLHIAFVRTKEDTWQVRSGQ
ncbi:hypothetical protein [Caballeronia grimmiae]|uniref:hypothetical protein n=1 Tax=Caballeronia grimmiae TaxID=1071679 RepID=UPI0038BDD440